jgi:hypothetical protein
VRGKPNRRKVGVSKNARPDNRMRDSGRLLLAMIEDVALVKGNEIVLRVRFKGEYNSNGRTLQTGGLVIVRGLEIS